MSDHTLIAIRSVKADFLAGPAFLRACLLHVSGHVRRAETAQRSSASDRNGTGAREIAPCNDQRGEIGLRGTRPVINRRKTLPREPSVRRGLVPAYAGNRVLL